MIHHRIFSGLLLLNLISSVNLSCSGSPAADIAENLLSTMNAEYITQYFEHNHIPPAFKKQIRKYLLSQYGTEIESILKDRQIQKIVPIALCSLYAEQISLGIYDNISQRAITTQGNVSLLWNLRNPTRPTYSQFPTNAPFTMAIFNPCDEHHVLTLNQDNVIEYWDLENLDNKLSFKPVLAVTALTFSSNGKGAFIAFENQSIYYCSFKHFLTLRCIIPQSFGKVTALTCHVGNNYLITCDTKGIIHFWNSQDGSKILTFDSKPYIHSLSDDNLAPSIIDLKTINNSELLAINYKTSHGCGTLNLNFSQFKKYLKSLQDTESEEFLDLDTCITSDMFMLFNKKARSSLLSLNYADNGTDFYPMYKNGALEQMQIMRNLQCDSETFETKDLMLLLLAYNQRSMLYQ